MSNDPNPKDRLHNSRTMQPYRRKLRRRLTPAEAALWKVLQNSKVDGRKFRRQYSVGNYVMDFYCPAERLCIELDGEVHNNDLAMERDSEKAIFLRGFGIKVIRFENKLVFEELEYVIARIRANFGWWRSSTTPSAANDAAATPPNQGGEF